MAADFVGRVAWRFQLECRMFEVEVADEAGLEGVEDLGGPSVEEARLVHDDVGGQGR
jgi:hypothetical protein